MQREKQGITLFHLKWCCGVVYTCSYMYYIHVLQELDLKFLKQR